MEGPFSALPPFTKQVLRDFGSDVTSCALQNHNHELNETSLKGLDIVVEEARLAGLKLILSLADNWKYPGGVDEYVDRSKTAPKRGPDQLRPPDQLGDADLTVRTDRCVPRFLNRAHDFRHYSKTLG